MRLDSETNDTPPIRSREKKKSGFGYAPILGISNGWITMKEAGESAERETRNSNGSLAHFLRGCSTGLRPWLKVNCLLVESVMARQDDGDHRIGTNWTGFNQAGPAKSGSPIDNFLCLGREEPRAWNTVAGSRPSGRALSSEYQLNAPEYAEYSVEYSLHLSGVREVLRTQT